MPDSRLAGIQWLGHDSFLIADQATGHRIYVDPYQLKHRYEPADLILISHDHFDHYSPDDIKKLVKPDTTFVAVPSVATQLSGNVIAVRPGDRITAGGVPIEAVAAYNTNKYRSPGVHFHPKEAGGVGFVLTVNGQRIYHTGDTDVIPEMGDVGPVDVALIPVSGTYVMTADEAAEAAARIKPKLAVPMHYAAIVGSAADAERFRQLCAVRGIPVEILPAS